MFRNSFTAPGSPTSPQPRSAPPRQPELEAGAQARRTRSRPPRNPGAPGRRGGRRRSRAFRHVCSLTCLASFVSLVSVFCVFKVCQLVDVLKKMEHLLSESIQVLHSVTHKHSSRFLLVFEPANGAPAQEWRAGRGGAGRGVPCTCSGRAQSRGLHVLTPEGRTKHGGGCVDTAVGWIHNLCPSSVNPLSALLPPAFS